MRVRAKARHIQPAAVMAEKAKPRHIQAAVAVGTAVQQEQLLVPEMETVGVAAVVFADVPKVDHTGLDSDQED